MTLTTRVAIAFALSVIVPAQALAQAGLGARGFDAERADIAPPRPAAPAPMAVAQPEVRAASLPDIVIRDVAIVGDVLLDRAVLARAVAPFAGRRLDRAQVEAIALALTAAHRAEGLALFGVVVPQQDFAGGLVIVRVIEGQVADIVIQGDTEGADLSLTRAYAEALRTERPLRQATLERQILLISDIPGRRVTSRFEAMETPGQVRLVLDVQRTSVRLGLGLDNLGARELGQVQFTLGATVNSLLREGDSTRLTYGGPTDFARFSYVALRHQQPIGTSGLTLSGNVSFLEQRRTGDSSLRGITTTVGFQAVYPVIRSTTRTLQVFGGLDLLDARAEFPAGRMTDEATRVIRTGAVYALSNAAQTTGASLAVVLSQGLDVAGARQGVRFYGDPGFTKATFIGSFQHALLEQRLVLRLRASAQVTNERLPSSELFTYGGVMFGRGFNAATLAGDRGIAASATLAVPFRTLFDVEAAAAGRPAILARMLRGGEAYVFADAARVENLQPLLARRGDRAASAGFGLALPVADETSLALEAAAPVVRPFAREVDRGFRFVAVFRRSF